MADPRNDPYRQLIDQDYMVAPPSEAEAGQYAAEDIYNDMVNPVNTLMKTGEPMRIKYSPETIKRMQEDEEKFNKATMGRVPQSTQNPVEDVLFGKETAPQIPLLPSPKLSGQIQSANIPRLSEIAVKGTSSPRVGIPNPGSTSPTDVTEQEIAQRTRQTKENIDLNLQGTPQYYEAQKEKYASKIGGEEAQAASEMMMNAERQRQIEDQILQTEQDYKEAQSRAQRQIDSIGPIDPDRVWNNKSTWSKLALAIGAGFQGAIGSDAGLKMIQDIVQKDLEAQMKNQDAGIKSSQGLLSLLKPFADNKATLMRLANEVSLKMAENYGKYMKAGASRGAIPGLALKDTMNDYTKELLAADNMSNKNLLAASKQQQGRKMDDERLKMDALNARLSEARLKFDTQNMTESDARRLEGATAMAISAKRMKELENDKNFNPTSVKFAVSQAMQGKGVPGSLNPIEGEWVQNYINYFSYKRQALTGAAASDKEDERIRLIIAPDKTFSKKGIKLYQAMRAKDINGAINSMNPAALSRIQNIPEFREFDINRGKIGR